MPSLWTTSLIADAGQQTYWDQQTFLTGATKTYRPAADIRGSMSTLNFSRTTPTGMRDDYMQIAFHWAIEAGPGAPAVPLTGSQAASIETLMTTFWNSLKVQTYTTIRLQSFQWRDFGADFPRGEANTLKYSPTWRTTTVNTAGTMATGTELPHQIASTCTLTTGSRTHWGRFYFPMTGSGLLDVYGRVHLSFINGLLNATRTLFNGAVALPAITNPWVWSPRYGGLMSVREIHVDDVPDVQRRRRDKQVAVRSTATS